MSSPVPSGSPSVNSVVTNTSIILTWEPLPLEQQNGNVFMYHVIIYTLKTNASQEFDTDELSIEIPDLHPFYWYELVVAAETSVGVGPFSRPVIQQLPEASE